MILIRCGRGRDIRKSIIVLQMMLINIVISEQTQITRARLNQVLKIHPFAYVIFIDPLSSLLNIHRKGPYQFSTNRLILLKVTIDVLTGKKF